MDHTELHGAGQFGTEAMRTRRAVSCPKGQLQQQQHGKEQQQQQQQQKQRQNNCKRI